MRNKKVRCVYSSSEKFVGPCNSYCPIIKITLETLTDIVYQLNFLLSSSAANQQLENNLRCSIITGP